MAAIAVAHRVRYDPSSIERVLKVSTIKRLLRLRTLHMPDQHRLTAVMFTDLAGYATPMSRGTEDARALAERSRAHIRQFVERFDGEYQEEPGDSTLSSFPSAVDATGCALAIQESLNDEPEMQLRIGIHSGDVVFSDGHVYGDGVNVAARLEPLAKPGGILVSETIRDAIHGHPDAHARYLGSRRLKNVADPVRIYALEGRSNASPMGSVRRNRWDRLSWLRPVLYGAVIVVLGVVFWLNENRVLSNWALSTPEAFPGNSLQSPASVAGSDESSLQITEAQRQAAPTTSVAVLPFQMLSSKPEDAYFAAGLTQEIINGLTTVPQLLVTARTSAFHFNDTDLPIVEIANILGTAHVLEGSVRRSGDRVRISVQLIQASDGFHLWSKTYERTLKDEFTVQTDIAEDVAASLGVLLNESQRKLMAKAGVRDVDAFLAFHQGTALYYVAHVEGPLIPTLQRATEAYGIAIKRKPDFAQAYLERADLYSHVLMDELANKPAGAVSMTGLTREEAMHRLGADLDAAIRYETNAELRDVYRVDRMFLSTDWRGLETVLDRALLDWDGNFGNFMAHVAVTFGHADDVYRVARGRIQRDPLNPFTWAFGASSAIVLGKPDAALRLLDEARKLIGPSHYITDVHLHALFALKRTAEAQTIIASGFEVSPILRVQVPAMAGDQAAAKAAFAHMIETEDPDLIRDLIAVNVIGDRAAANRAAAAMDAHPLGAAMLVRAYQLCLCGAMFDLQATPNFAQRLEESNLPWPPLSPIEWPLKDW